MTTPQAINTHCPWSGDPVQGDSLTRYRGHVVGFCNPGCRDKFDQAVQAFERLIDDPSAMKAGFRRLAHYNRWFNARLYDACARLSEDDLHRDAGAFFGSVHGTLNHIMVWDVTWLQRFRGHERAFPSLDVMRRYPRPTAHDDILYADLKSLLDARAHIDSVLAEFIEDTRDADYDSIFAYTVSSGETYRKNFGGMIQHLFNHQTHHRGQITALLFQMGIDPGTTDLLVTLPEEGSL